MEEAARPATGADLERLTALAEETVAEFAPQRGGGIWAAREARPTPARESLAAAVGDPEQLVVAGTIDDVVVGYAVVRTEPLRNGQTLGVITDLYVEPGAREVGVGEAMVNLVLEWCGERRCTGIDGLALPGARNTKNFFESFGFTARAIVVHRRLGAETG